MPDGGISPVRFEVLTFLHRPFPLRQGSSAGSHTPCLRGLPTASSPGQRPATAPVLSSRPPTLTWKPPSTQSPFAHSRCYLPWGDVVRLLRGHCSPFPAHTDSCAKPCWLSLPSVLPSVRESLQVATSPCCQRVLPDSISANLSPDAWSPTPTVPPSACTCFFPGVIGLPQDTMGRLPVSFRERDFPRASFRGCRHFVMFRPLSLRRLPDRSYRCESPHRAAETFTSEHIVLCYLRTLRICYPPIQVIDGKRTFTFPDLQPCRLLQCLTSLADCLTYFALC